MEKKGRKPHQEAEFRKNHEAIIKALQGELKGQTVANLVQKTGLRSRKTVYKHLNSLSFQHKVSQEGKKYFWAHPNKQLKDQLQQLQQELEATYNRLVQKKILEAIKQGRKYISAAEIINVRASVLEEMKRPKIGDLYEFHEKRKKEGFLKKNKQL